MQEFGLFAPENDRSLKVDFPELKYVPEFENLTSNEMLFVWYYACRSSPFFGIKKVKERREKALEASFKTEGKRKSISDVDRTRYLTGKYPDKISKAIDKMEKFKPHVRIRMMQTMWRGWEILEEVIQKYKRTGEIDEDKNFIAVLKSAVELSPSLLEKLEANYSIRKKEDKKGSTFEGGNFMDNYMKEKED